METKEKTVRIDMDNRILAFQPIENGNRITKAESLFWDFVCGLMNAGYRIM